MVLIALVWPYLPRLIRPNLIDLRLGHTTTSIYESKVSDEELQNLKLNKVRKWIAVEDGITWIIVTATGSSGRSKLHDPTYCLVGEGWKLISEKKLIFEQGTALILYLNKNNDHRQCAYMYFNGRVAYFSPLKYWFDTAINNLTLGFIGSETEMILLYPSRNLDWDEWEKCSIKLLPLLVGSD